MIRKIKRNRPYTPDEAAHLTGVTPVTIRRWRERGLMSIPETRPAIILGCDLIDFVKAQQTPKQHCQPHECYCLKCRAPRAPAFDEVEIIVINVRSGNMRALCCECTTVMHKRIPLAAVDALRSEHGLTVTLRCERITEDT
ncbi:MerR family DNA-binding transcriptional regulator [Mesorhizobium sp. VNQ89]|uniref:MerR family DNA-binding transcriptional regulator n=1 Tax=Mesorhizobium quangtriensis TaxID=3157709 RepID=UPI0032B74A3B